MANINIKNLLGNGEMAYDRVYTEDKFEWFKSDEDAYIYVMNTENKRCTRYNSEAQNGKRISVEEFESKLADMLPRIAKQETEESANTEEAKEIELNMAMEKLGYYPIDSEWNDIRYSTCDGQSKVMAWDTVEEGLAWANAMLDTEVKEPEPVNYCRHPEGTDLQKPAVINQYGCVDCSKCNVQNCVHRDCMRRNPTSVGGLGECPRLKVKKQGPTPKKKRTRKSKDIAYEGHEVTLTAKQVDFIRHLPDTNFWENGLNSALWTDVLADEIGGQFAGKPMTTGAMISTICEKGLASRATDHINGRKSTFMVLTELGKKVAAELGLN